MIELQGVSKYYAGVKAIEDVSFRIEEGEIVGLLGPNGAGKSTILKILGTYLAPSRGTALINGFSTFDKADRVREVIGYLPDVPPLYDEMSVIAYLRFVAKLKNVPPDKVESRVNSVIKNTNIDGVINKPLGTLSHGFRQRVGIAQTLVHEPKVIIMDEPMSGLDPIQIVEMRDLILGLKNKYTLILSSHILSEITKTCDRILVIDHGNLVAEGSEEELAGSIVNQQKIELRFKGGAQQIIPALEQLQGIKKMHREEGNNEIITIYIDTSSDIRPQIARTVMSHGGELYHIGKLEEGLESLFLKLIKNG